MSDITNYGFFFYVGHAYWCLGVNMNFNPNSMSVVKSFNNN